MRSAKTAEKYKAYTVLGYFEEIGRYGTVGSGSMYCLFRKRTGSLKLNFFKAPLSISTVLSCRILFLSFFSPGKLEDVDKKMKLNWHRVKIRYIR